MHSFLFTPLNAGQTLYILHIYIWAGRVLMIKIKVLPCCFRFSILHFNFKICYICCIHFFSSHFSFKTWCTNVCFVQCWKFSFIRPFMAKWTILTTTKNNIISLMVYSLLHYFLIIIICKHCDFVCFFFGFFPNAFFDVVHYFCGYCYSQNYFSYWHD